MFVKHILKQKKKPLEKTLSAKQGLKFWPNFEPVGLTRSGWPEIFDATINRTKDIDLTRKLNQN